MKNKNNLFILLIISILQVFPCNANTSQTSQSVKSLYTSRQYSTIDLSYQSDFLKKSTKDHQSFLSLELGTYNSINQFHSIYFGVTAVTNTIDNTGALESVTANYTINHNTVIDQISMLSIILPTQSIFVKNIKERAYADIKLNHDFFYKNYQLSMAGFYRFYKYKINQNLNYNFPYSLSANLSSEYIIHPKIFFNISLGLNIDINYKGNQKNQFSSSQSLSYLLNKETLLSIGHTLDNQLYNIYSTTKIYTSSYFLSFSREF